MTNLEQSNEEIPAAEPPVVKEGKAPRIESYFSAMIKLDASDVHLKSGCPPIFRVSANLRASKTPPLPNPEIEAMALEILNPEQKKFYADHGSIDLAYQIPGSDRFRVNIFRQRGMTTVVARRVKRGIPDFEKLHLPPVIRQIAEDSQGLVLVAGPTGSGKSTTIASILEYINATRATHIITLEDPIEYLYDDKKSIINQREIGIDVPNFMQALKYVLREDPDIILVGEMRDNETFKAALQASETGHLVFGTVHASTAPQTIGRILDLFPPEARDLIRQGLAFNLKAIVCQKLLPSINPDVRRVPAVEVMTMNPTVRLLIQEKRDAELADLIKGHEREGMQSFTTSLLKLIDTELIDPRIAYEVAPNVDELKMRMKGITTGGQGGLVRK